MDNLSSQIMLLKDSGMFDEEWYLNNYIDVEISGIDPVKHYLIYGAIMGRNPSSDFDTIDYWQSNPDVKEQKINPLWHYLRYGRKEGRILNEKYYLHLFSHPDSNIQNGVKIRIETFDCIGFAGWFSPPKNTLLEEWSILLKIDDEPISATIANVERKDVVRAIKQNAAGFSLGIPEKFLDGKEHQAQIYGHYRNEKAILTIKKFSLRSAWELERKPSELEKTIVLFCSHNLKIQGAQTSLMELAAGLKTRSLIEPVVYSPTDGPMRKRYEAIGIKVIVQRQPNYSNVPEDNWKTEFKHFAEGIRRLSPRAVISNTLESFQSAIAAKEVGIPYLLIPRESEPPDTYFSRLPLFIRKKAESIVENGDAVVFVANSTRELWESKNTRNHFHTIYNGLNTSVIEDKSAGKTRDEIRLNFGIKANEIIILSVGTVTERKGQLDLIKAIPVIKDLINTPFRLFLVGMNESKYSKEIEALVSTFPSDIAKKIHLLPQTESNTDSIVTDLYLASDLFVLNSRHESYPRVILEALYFNLPVVSTPCFGVCEQVVEKECALYYEAGDYNKLASNISFLINNPKILKDYRNNAKNRYPKLTNYEQMVSAYKDILMTILD